MRWTISLIVVCSALVGSLVERRDAPAAPPIDRASAACLACHASAGAVLSGAMATRSAERRFAVRAFGHEGSRFFDGSCGGCHVSACRDCHGEAGHPTAAPSDEACLRCHRGYFTGAEYYGRAPREDHVRYQRGPAAGGEPFLKMLPDIHQERGLTCAACHTMRSMIEGRGSARTCVDCHPSVSPDVPEHAVKPHLERMTCEACHSAWAPQEYGTFIVRDATDEQQAAFSALPRWGDWSKSAYLKRQDAPPLGLDARGLVAPIRPEFILFATDVDRRWENRLLAAEWKAFFPHTTRRGASECGGCHDQPRRFLLEPDGDRIYRLERDGLALRSFWDRRGQTMTNGAFFPADRYARMNARTPEYVRGYLKQWQNLLGHVVPSSKP